MTGEAKIVNVAPPSVEASAVMVADLPEAAVTVPLTTQLYSPTTALEDVAAVQAPAEFDQTSEFPLTLRVEVPVLATDR